MAKKRCEASGTRVVVDARGVDVQHLPPEDLLRRADVADAREQLVEVVRRPAGLLQALVVQREALDEVLPQALRRPDAGTGCRAWIDPVAHGDDGTRGYVALDQPPQPPAPPPD